MGKNKKNKSNVPFNPPVRQPQNMAVMAKQLGREMDAVRLESSNQTLNLCASAFIIVLKEFYDFEPCKLQEVMNRVFEQLELCGKELVTLDQMMDLCEEYSIEVKKDAAKMDSIGKLMQDKLNVYQLLDKGVTEVEDIAKQTGLTTREASAYRWQYNKLKYGKDYEGDVEMATNKQIAFDMFDQGKGIEEVVSATGVLESSAGTYRREWKRDRMSELTPDEAASFLCGEVALHTLIQQKRGVKPITEVKEEVIKEVPKPEEVNKVMVEAPKKHGLRKVVEIVRIEGDMAQYRPNADFIDIEIDGQVLTLNKADMVEFANEMLAVVQEM